MLNRFNVMGIIGLIVATVLITLTNDVMDGILLFALSGIALRVRTEDEESKEEEA